MTKNNIICAAKAYEAPSCEALAVNAQSVLCVSFENGGIDDGRGEVWPNI